MSCAVKGYRSHSGLKENDRNRLRAQRKFAQGSYIPPINPSSNGPNVPVLNTSQRASNAQGLVILNESSAINLFTKLSLRRNHKHGGWMFKPGSYSTPSLQSSNFKKKSKQKKITKTNVFKKRHNMRRINKKITTNTRRDSDASESDAIPLSNLTTNYENSVPEPCTTSLLQEQTAQSSTHEINDPNPETTTQECAPSSGHYNTRRARITTRDPCFSYSEETSVITAAIRDTDRTYTSLIPSDHEIKYCTRRKTRINMKKPCSRKTVATSSMTQLVEPDVDAELDAEVDAIFERSLPLEVSYNDTADWVRNHHLTPKASAISDNSQKQADGGNQFKIPKLPVRFTKTGNIDVTGPIENEALEAPGRRLRSAKVGGKNHVSKTNSSGLRKQKKVRSPSQMETDASAAGALPAPAAPTARASSPALSPASSNDARQLVVCITPLEDIILQNLTHNDTHQESEPSLSSVEQINMDNTSASTSQCDVIDNTPMETTQVISERLEKGNGRTFDFPLHIEEMLMALQFPSETSKPTPTEIMTSETLLVFRPSPEEFKNPMAYIKKVQEKAEQYGICKIVPPEEFHIPITLDETAKFSTVSHYLGRLYHRWGPASRELAFILTCASMLAKDRERDQFSKAPLLEGTEVDLVKLYHLVVYEGGIRVMLTGGGNKWVKVVRKMGYGCMDYKKLEKIYCKYVLPYESLSLYDRASFQSKVEAVWEIRHRNALHRANYPLNYNHKLLGETCTEIQEETPAPHLQDVWVAGKSVFDRIEECVSKGRIINITNYRQISDRAERMRYKSRRNRSPAELEREYWSVVSLGLEHTSVISGCIDTSVKHLGHPADRNEDGGTHPWNLKRLTEDPANVLSSLGKSLSVTEPTLSLNQRFSTSCWHIDPHNLTWIDFLHEGPTKIWYGVAAKDDLKFRSAMKTLEPSVVQEKGIWLASDTTMVPPSKLCHQGVQLQRVEQNVGEYLVVFPGAYASSVATGLSISESVYVGHSSYINRIDATFRQMRVDSEPTMFSNTMLLMRMVTNPNVSMEILTTVHLLLDKIFQDEADARREAVKLKCDIHVIADREAESRWPVSWPYQEECFICRAPLILSKSVRFDNPRQLMCLKHALRVYSCALAEGRGPPPPVKFIYSMEELNTHMGELRERLLAGSDSGIM